MSTPFTYLIRCIPTGQLYYGVRYAKTANPNSLWKTYFTSSKKVKTLIELYGEDAFEYEVRKIFKTADAARSWEHRVLTRMKVRENPLWLNTHIWGEKFFNDGTGYKPSQYRIMRTKHALTGKRKSEATRQKMSASMKGRQMSEIHRERIANYRSKHWIVTYPDGHIEEVFNLTKFARDNKLDPPTLLLTSKKDRKTYPHKGFTASRIE